MVDYNPNQPWLSGLEQRSRGRAGRRVGSPAQQQIVRWRASDSAQVGTVGVYLDQGSAPLVEAGPQAIYNGGVGPEAYPAGNPRAGLLVDVTTRANELVTAGLQADTYTVNGVVVRPTATGWYRGPTQVGDPAGVDDIVNDNLDRYAFTSATKRCAMGVLFTSNGFPTGRHVVGVEFTIRSCGPIHASVDHLQGTTWIGELNPMAFDSPLPAPGELPTEFVYHTFRIGEMFASRTLGGAGGQDRTDTMRAWTRVDVNEFDMTVGPQRRLSLTTHKLGAAIAYVSMTVYSIPERRVATGILVPNVTAPGFFSATLREPGGAIWTKVQGVDYSTVVRQPVAGNTGLGKATATIRRLPRPVVPIPFHESVAVATTDSGGSGQPTSAAAPDAAIIPFLVVDAFGPVLAETMPYVEAATVTCGAGMTFPVRGTGQTLSVAYLLLADEFAPATFESLAWKLTDGPGGTGAFVEGSISRADIDGSPQVAVEPFALGGVTKVLTWRRVRLDLGAGRTIANGSIGSLIISSTTPTAFGSTERVLLGSLRASSGQLAQSWLGTDGVDFAEDAQAVVAVKPPLVTGVTATVTATSYGGAAAKYVAVSFTPPASVPAGFAYYEVQRSDPRTEGAPIARLTTVTDSTFADHEARYGEVSTYRVRAVDVYGTEGDWSNPSLVVLPALTGSPLTFTTNEAPTLSVVAEDTYTGTPTREYGFPEAAELVTRLVYGRDLPVAFRPAVKRGATFTRRLKVASGRCPPVSPVGPGRMDRLRDLAVADVSYVCVRDTAGNRFFGAITIPDGQVTNFPRLHEATVGFVETFAMPSTPGAPYGYDGSCQQYGDGGY